MKSTLKRSKDVTQTQQQRPESPTVPLTWHASKHKVHERHQRYILKNGCLWRIYTFIFGIGIYTLHFGYWHIIIPFIFGNGPFTLYFNDSYSYLRKDKNTALQRPNRAVMHVHLAQKGRRLPENQPYSHRNKCQDNKKIFHINIIVMMIKKGCWRSKTRSKYINVQKEGQFNHDTTKHARI